ncbi:MAG: hypothetical protein EOO24_21410 [Comamonadaceae bacterium]|nr:MAG: hypothetical protein EOO24_21410 [Comamonadaceae bacterium]
MATRLDDLRIRPVRPIVSPALLQYDLPTDAATEAFIEHSRREVAEVVHGRDPRLLVVVGPCSIHDTAQALEYATLLKAAAGRQDLKVGQPLQHGVSITDACIGWQATEGVLEELAAAVRARR